MQIVVVFFLPSEKGSILKGRNLLQMRANSSFVEQTPFQKASCVQENKREISKLSPLQKKGR